MITTLRKITRESGRPRLLTVFFVALFLAGTIPGTSVAATILYYQQTNLDSDKAGEAATTDPNLKGAWGIARSATSPWWVNSTHDNVSLGYDGNGAPFPVSQPIVVTTPPTPTGIVFNGSSDFNLSTGPASPRPASYIFASLNGTISAWNRQVDAGAAIVKVDNSGAASYTGLALAPSNDTNHLFAANFGQSRIDVFDKDFNPVPLAAGAFTDPKIPGKFSPFNVQAINNTLYVTYARKDVFQTTGGANNGFVDVFDTNGGLIMRLKHGTWMHAPWGVALAPNDFGKFSNAILVGMFGNGEIAAFNATNGKFRGFLKGANGRPIAISKGLWGLGFGAGNANSGAANTLYFASDIDGTDGVFGMLTAAQKTVRSPPPSPMPSPSSGY